MTEDRIELVDREYGQVVRENPSRQIKTRSTSFRNIREKFNQFRVRQLQKKLERKIESALTQGYTEDNFERKITKNANIIAKIEEKIMILSKENVPTDYVAKRAIKLRKNMIANLTYNVGTMYTVGLENRDAVFGNEALEDIPEEAAFEKPVEVVESPVEEKEETVAPVEEEKSTEDATLPDEGLLAAAIPADTSSDEIDVVPSDLERQGIVDAVNSSFDEIKENDTPTEENITADEVREVVDESLEKVSESTATEIPVEAPKEETVVDRETVRQMIDEAFKAMEETNRAEGLPLVEPRVDAPTSVEESVPVVEDAVTRAEGVSEQPVQETVVEAQPVAEESAISPEEEAAIHDEVERAIEKIRVSRNNATPVNASQYDENGYRRERRKKYNYTPMTDEEIRQSQIKLGFDEHGNLIDNGKRKGPESVSSARIVGSFIAPGSIPKLTLEDVFVPANKQIREVPIVVPDRDDSSLGLDLDDGKSMFELIEQPAEEKKVEVPTATEGATVDDYNELKKKLLFLQQQKQLTHQQKMEAQKAAEEAAQQAQEARRLYEVSQANYNQRMERLRAYTATLEADCSENVRSMELAEEEARRDASFAQEQRELADNNSRIIGEIDSMIGNPEAGTALRVR